MTICTVHDPSSLGALPTHPLRSRATVLLCSVFGPYARDDEYGSRVVNPMELYHNQVTRVEGAFSYRKSHRSWGLMFIQANIDAPCTVLDFPSLDRFVAEIRDNDYDIVGLSSIWVNLRKVEDMCERIREHLPRATIVVGGHIANVPNLDRRINADYVVRGDGVRWFRRFLGEDEEKPIRHPLMWAGFGTRTMGVNVPRHVRNEAAVLIPSVGCPLGCDFCSTSAMFGGRGKFTHFYETGDELFDIMCQLERKMKVEGFFVMDENFLLYRRRALRLLELMRESEKPWLLFVFSSANVLKSYTIEQLVGLGIAQVWIGLEGKDSHYAKLKGVDTLSLVRELQSHGIHVVGSTIIGLREHTRDNIDEAIDHAVAHETDFHQFMLLMPVPGTPAYAEHSAKGLLLDSSAIDEADCHGQYRFNYRHPHIEPGDETEFLLRAFRRDFEVNGPSIARAFRTKLRGWKRYKGHSERRIRERFARQVRGVATLYAGGVWAGRRWFKDNPVVCSKLTALLEEIYGEFGLKSRIAAPLIGRVLLYAARREDKRLAKGWTLKHPTFYEKNFEDRAPNAKRLADRLRWVVSAPPPKTMLQHDAA